MGQVCRALLEVLNEDYANGLKELHSLMVVSQMLFYVDGGRRVTLCTELDKHPIWTNTELWKLTLQRVINLKFQEAVTNLEK